MLQQGEWLFTTEGHPLPLDHANHQPRQGWAPGKATEATLRKHPFFQDASSQWASAFGLLLGPGACLDREQQHCNTTAPPAGSSASKVRTPCSICPARRPGKATRDPWWCAPGALAKGRGTPMRPAACRNVAAGRAIDENWGTFDSAYTAMHARVCINREYEGPAGQLQSLCHKLDRWPDHSCLEHQDCGIDAKLCRRRTCSPHHYCTASPLPSLIVQSR